MQPPPALGRNMARSFSEPRNRLVKAGNRHAKFRHDHTITRHLAAGLEVEPLLSAEPVLHHETQMQDVTDHFSCDRTRSVGQRTDVASGDGPPQVPGTMLHWAITLVHVLIKDNCAIPIRDTVPLNSNGLTALR